MHEGHSVLTPPPPHPRLTPSSKENSNFEGLIFRQISDVNDITTF